MYGYRGTTTSPESRDLSLSISSAKSGFPAIINFTPLLTYLILSIARSCLFNEQILLG